MTFLARLAAVLAAPLLLSGCLFLPGQFDSSLKLMKDGSYEFTYVGEMQILSGGERDMRPPKEEPFDPDKAYCETYYDVDGGVSQTSDYRYWQGVEEAAVEAAAETMIDSDGSNLPRTEERECTKDELALLRDEEAQRFARKKQDYEQRAGVAARLFGGAIPGNEASLRKFAAQLAKYDGWDKVEYIGDDKFAVEYRASGQFDRYFAFPVLPDGVAQFPFYHIVPRADGALELLSPGIGSDGGGISSLMLLGAMRDAEDGLNLDQVKGSFTLETDAEVIANNAADGYTIEGSNKVMRWQIEGMSEAPRALVRLEQ